MPEIKADTEQVKALALRCKTLEAQLRQSVPKKDHNEITSKLEKQIVSLERDLDRARAENQKTIAINKQIIGVEGQIAAVIKAAGGLGKTVDSIDATFLTTRKALSEQARTLDAINSRLAQGTVPASIHQEALSKINNLESRCDDLTRQIANMVPSREFISVNDRLTEANRRLSMMVPASELAEAKRRISTMVPASDLEEANRRISTMVPATELEEANARIAAMVPVSDFVAAKQKADDLESAIATMVPREQLVAAEARIAELEDVAAHRVPQDVYDELVSKVVSLAETVTGGEIKPSTSQETVEEPVQAYEIPETESIAEPAVEVETPAVEAPITEAVPEVAPEPVPEVVAEVAPEVAPETPIETVPEAIVVTAAAPAQPETVEIREVQSQLAELATQAQETTVEVVAPVIGAESPAVEAPATTPPAIEVTVSDKSSSDIASS